MSNNFEQNPLAYNESARNWQKSAEEIAKFILDHLSDRQEFLEFIRGEEVTPEKAERWQERLNELSSKAVKRIGHQIDKEELLLSARQIILDRRLAGELPPSSEYENFCKLSLEEFKLSC